MNYEDVNVDEGTNWQDENTTQDSNEYGLSEEITDTTEVVGEEPIEKPARKSKSKAKKDKEQEDFSQEDEAIKISTPVSQRENDSVLTINVYDDIESDSENEATRWHAIQNAYRTRRILTATLAGLETISNGSQTAIIYYNGFRVVIPLDEMNIIVSEDNDFGTADERMGKIATGMMGAEIDFIVKGIENETRSIVASRATAMKMKRKQFYFNTNYAGHAMIYPGRLAQARVVLVSERFIRVELFGAETNILARNLSWDWISDASSEYSVGDTMVVKIKEVNLTEDNAYIEADLKSLKDDGSALALENCKRQGKYAGIVGGINKGVVHVKLKNGANVIAHSCNDRRVPGKGDYVLLVITDILEEQRIALGIITKIIKQNF